MFEIKRNWIWCSVCNKRASRVSWANNDQYIRREEFPPELQPKHDVVVKGITSIEVECHGVTANGYLLPDGSLSQLHVTRVVNNFDLKNLTSW
jgi:hypothetical protein